MTFYSPAVHFPGCFAKKNLPNWHFSCQTSNRGLNRKKHDVKGTKKSFSNNLNSLCFRFCWPCVSILWNPNEHQGVLLLQADINTQISNIYHFLQGPVHLNNHKFHVPWRATTILKNGGSFLDDDKPLLKQWWFGNQPIKKWWPRTSREYYVPSESRKDKTSTKVGVGLLVMTIDSFEEKQTKTSQIMWKTMNPTKKKQAWRCYWPWLYCSESNCKLQWLVHFVHHLQRSARPMRHLRNWQEFFSSRSR